MKWILMLFLSTSTPPAVYFEDEISCNNAGNAVIELEAKYMPKHMASENHFLCVRSASS